MASEAEQYNQGGGYSSSQNTIYHNPAFMDVDIEKFHLDNDDIIEKFQHSYRSEYFDGKIGQWRQIPGTKPLMNEQAIQKYSNRINMISEKFHGLTYYKEEWVFDIIMMPLAETIIFDIHHNWDHYGFSDSSVPSMLVEDILEIAFSSMNRSREGLGVEMRKNTQSVQQQLTNKDNKPGGFFGSLFAPRANY